MVTDKDHQDKFIAYDDYAEDVSGKDIIERCLVALVM
jgi:hypothetical protein